ncbi:MAG: right-handed parallel beta-helix repeat-containing protein [Candidatus Accumulibacter sp.]|nr:right-handed parallel beta-helix repeat-containing protein [Accumulibacter sp.]
MILALLSASGAAALWGLARNANTLFPAVFDGSGPGLYWGRTPSELIRHARKRLSGHPRLELVILPALDVVQRWYERPVPGMLDNLGKGQREVSDADLLADIHAGSVEALAQAMRDVRPGQIIEILPGRYEVRNPLNTMVAGTASRPITVRAARVGEVVLLVGVAEGIRLTQPYWIFENLDFRGICEDDGNCDHAFHVVGEAGHAIIRNNRMQDFNAHVKVNGEGGAWPDEGSLQFNTLTNSRPRNTMLPVTFFDLVGADGWRVEDNLFIRFVKRDGNQASYGMFMKGNSRGGIIERNLVVCTPDAISQPGVRVGISLGNGGTGNAFCRDGNCRFEHRSARVANNIVAHCNDSGIDVFKSSDVLIAHNTLINTSGIDVRGAGSSARIIGNLLEGSIRGRFGVSIRQERNEVGDVRGLFSDADALSLSWSGMRDPVEEMADVTTDFCGQPRGIAGFLGASSARGGC